jgi:glycosyltransferase involved in cell wall biosynthesis
LRSYDISIVTVVKNDLAGLIRTFDSIKAQAGIEIEILIVDGGSIDGSSRFAIENSSVHIEPRNDGGIYQGMQRGLNCATSEYVLFLNSGDVLNGVLHLAESYKKIRQENVLWGFGSIIELTQRNTLNLQESLGFLETSQIILRKTFVPFPTVIASKDVLTQANAFEFKYKIAEDFYTICKLSQLGKPVFWDNPLVIFSAGGISYTRAPQAYVEELLIQFSSLPKSMFHKAVLRYFVKNFRWLGGRLLDSIYARLPIKFTHWRDLKSKTYEIPEV